MTKDELKEALHEYEEERRLKKQKELEGQMNQIDNSTGSFFVWIAKDFIYTIKLLGIIIISAPLIYLLANYVLEVFNVLDNSIWAIITTFIAEMLLSIIYVLMIPENN